MKNVKLNTRLVSLILAGTLTLSTTGCGKKETNLMPIDELLQIEEVQDLTLIDELIKAGKLYYGLNSNIIEEASYLEKFLQIEQITKEMNYQEIYANIEEYQKEEKKFNANINLWDLTLGEVETLKEKAKMNVKSYTDITTRQKALQMLYYINQSAKEMVEYNGANTLILLLFTAVRASVAEDLSLGVEEFNTVNILDSAPSKTGKDSYYIIIKDEPYEIKPSEKELWESLDYAFRLRQMTPPIRYDYDFYKKGLDLAKMVILEGTNVKKDTIKQERSSSYVKKNYTQDKEK